jgi:glycosyltransferase involved in cell wall biosynthesis
MDVEDQSCWVQKAFIFMKKILIVSTQRPYYGGAATNAYALIKHFRGAGYKTAGVFFDKTGGSIDPDRIGGVIAHKCNKSSKEAVMRVLGGSPDLIFAKNYAAPRLIKKIFPKSTLVYLVSGSPQMMKLSARNISANRYLASKDIEVFAGERKAVSISDYVVPNSPIGRRLLVKHYGDLQKILKPVNTSLATNIVTRNIQFSRRSIDVAFICSNMNRSVKNSALAKDIFSKLNSRSKVAVGVGADMFKGMKNTKYFGLLNNQVIINILSNTKLVICTSYYDASPNIISEALGCGSNILVSKNCGWSEIYPAKFVCKDVYDQKEWVRKAHSLTRNNVKFSITQNNMIIADLMRILK